MSPGFTHRFLLDDGPLGIYSAPEVPFPETEALPACESAGATAHALVASELLGCIPERTGAAPEGL